MDELIGAQRQVLGRRLQGRRPYQEVVLVIERVERLDVRGDFLGDLGRCLGRPSGQGPCHRRVGGGEVDRRRVEGRLHRAADRNERRRRGRRRCVCHRGGGERVVARRVVRALPDDGDDRDDDQDCHQNQHDLAEIFGPSSGGGCCLLRRCFHRCCRRDVVCRAAHAVGARWHHRHHERLRLALRSEAEVGLRRKQTNRRERGRARWRRRRGGPLARPGGVERSDGWRWSLGGQRLEVGCRPRGVRMDPGRGSARPRGRDTTRRRERGRRCGRARALRLCRRCQRRLRGDGRHRSHRWLRDGSGPPIPLPNRFQNGCQPVVDGLAGIAREREEARQARRHRRLFVVHFPVPSHTIGQIHEINRASFRVAFHSSRFRFNPTVT